MNTDTAVQHFKAICVIGDRAAADKARDPLIRAQLGPDYAEVVKILTDKADKNEADYVAEYGETPQETVDRLGPLDLGIVYEEAENG